MSYVFEGLKPERLWHYFFELNQIPRESKHEAEAAEWVFKVAKELGLPVKQDEVGNVLVTKPATPGYENGPTVCLQGHVDMVCEKNSGTEHDFRKDPIDMYIDGDFVKARGTTLGADNGIGVATALAIMEAKDIPHPPMEFLFTIDEETGLTGANALKPGFVNSDILINCDSEDDYELYVGCAGGKDTSISLKLVSEAAKAGKAYELSLTGFRGGHSGLDINTGRGNATKQLNRVLFKLNEETGMQLFYINGGSKHNAIPREAFSKFIMPEADIDTLLQTVKDYEKVIKNEFSGVEDTAKLQLTELSEAPAEAFTKESQAKIINLLYALPHGVKAMSLAIPDLVETSTNLAIVETKDNVLTILTSQRSSIESAKNDIADKVKANGLLAGAEVKQGNGYPGWKPNLDSKILATMKQSFVDLYGKEPAVKAIHAGLECGIIGEQVPGIDMVSIGPNIMNPHSPDETVQISTIDRYWQVILYTLKTLKTK